jgi:hypothetical protein
MGLFTAKEKAQIAELEEQRALDDRIIEGLTETHHETLKRHEEALASLHDAHESDRRNWRDAMTAKENIWGREKARLEGMAEANKVDAERWRRLVYGDKWYSGGTAERGGHVMRLWERHLDVPQIAERILLSEGENPNAGEV